MAKSRRLGLTPMIRSRVRAGIRAGLGESAILSDVEGAYPNATEGSIRRIISQETTRQSAVDRIMSKDFRRRTNLHSIVGCGKGEQVRARITVTWVDPATGESRTYGHTTILQNQGVMSHILNSAIQEVLDDATGRGYQPPRITSGMTGGHTFYRLEYVECI